MSSALYRATPSPSPAATSTSTSLSRVAPYIDPTSLDVSKRLNELEMESSRTQARLVVAEREVAQKDQEMRRLMIEHRATKSGLEKVIRDLVEKNKSIELDFQRRHKLSEDAMQRLSSEHMAHAHASADVKQTVKEWKQMLQNRELEIQHWKQAHDNLEQAERNIQVQFDELQLHAQQLEDDLQMSRKQEDDVQQDLDLALEKLAKADAHIHKLSRESEQNAVELVRLRHLSDAAQVDTQTAKEEVAELTERLGHLSRSAAGEMDRLTLECDELLEFMKSWTLSKQRSKDMPSTFSDPHRPQRLFLLSPEKNSAEKSSGYQQPNAAPLLRRLIEAISLAREDLSVSHRAAMEMHRHCKDLDRRVEVLAEAIQEERTTAMEAVDRMQALEQSLSEEQQKVAKLEAAMTQSAKWMDEATSMGEESTARTEKLVKEHRDLQRQLVEAREELAQVPLQLAQRHEALEAVKRTLAALEVQHAECSERLRLSERRHHADADQVDEVQQRLQEKDKQLHQLENVIAKLDAEKSFLSKQLTDSEERSRTHQKHIDGLEKTASELRAKLFDTQKRLDNVLRQVTVSSSSAVAAATTPQRSQTATHGGPYSPVTSSSQTRWAPSSVSTPGAKTLNGTLSRVATGEASDALPPMASRVQGSEPATGSSVLNPTSGSADKVKSWEDRINALLNARSRV